MLGKDRIPYSEEFFFDGKVQLEGEAYAEPLVRNGVKYKIVRGGCDAVSRN